MTDLSITPTPNVQDAMEGVESLTFADSDEIKIEPKSDRKFGKIESRMQKRYKNNEKDWHALWKGFKGYNIRVSKPPLPVSEDTLKKMWAKYLADWELPLDTEGRPDYRYTDYSKYSPRNVMEFLYYGRKILDKQDVLNLLKEANYNIDMHLIARELSRKNR